MGDFFVYILKSSVCLAVFYLFYRLLLSRETFHRFNRVSLLGVIILSVVIPFIRIVTEEPVVIQRPLQNLEYLLQMAEMQTDVLVPTEQSVWLSLLLAVYLGGCIFFFIRFLYSTIRIFNLIGMGEKQVLPGGCKLVVTDKTVCPFSWMGYIVISRKDMGESGEEILTHELAHIHARHSIDMLACTFCVILQWFNPAVWLLKQELQNIHEYEADESVINHGVDAKKYQLLLIKKAVGSQRFTSMANSFNHSKLKKRITMMLKQKSNPWARLKYLYVLPLTAVAVVAFARPEISRELEKISSAKISEIVPVTATPSTVSDDTIRVVGAPINIQESMQKQLDDFAKSAEEGVKKAKQRVEASQYLILVDNEVSSYDQLDQISPENIESFGIEQKKNCQGVLDKFNAKDKKGVITVKTKEGIASGKVSKDEVRVVGYSTMDNLEKPLNIRVMKRDSAGVSVNATPLIIVDGEELVDKSVDEINPNTIESISVLKDESAATLYGEKGKNGVILITTKKKYKE